MKCDYCKQDKSYFDELIVTRYDDESVPFERKLLACEECFGLLEFREKAERNLHYK